MTILSPHQQTVSFRVLVFGLAACALASLLPLWAPLVLAAWVSTMARPLLLRAARVTGGRHRAAGGLVVALVMIMLLPIAGAALSLSRGAVDLAQAVTQSKGAKSALVAIASGGQPEHAGSGIETLKSPARIMELLKEHGAQAAEIASGIAGAATAILLGLFIFFYAVYVFLVDGPGQFEWIAEHAPLERRHTRRLAAAFHETGRGLFVGIGLTGLAQGAVATITYVALGVPRALVLGVVTCFASLIPSVGTALVWVPIAIGLALAGKTGSAAILAGVGVVVIGTVDNVMRPVFARFGQLHLSAFVLLLSIFGGLAAFGAWGLLLGPLFARLAKEALVIARSESLAERNIVERAADDAPDTPMAP